MTLKSVKRIILLSCLVASSVGTARGAGSALDPIVNRYLANFPERGVRFICGNVSFEERAKSRALLLAAATELYKLGPSQIPDLVQLLSSRDQGLAVLAKTALMMHGDVAARPVLSLAVSTKSPTPYLASLTGEIFKAYALSEQGIIVHELISAKTGLKDFRWQVASIVGRPKSSNSIPNPLGQALARDNALIFPALLDRSESVRESASHLVPLCAACLDDKSAQAGSDYVVRALSDSDVVVRQQAMNDLGYFNSVSQSAFAAMNRATTSSDSTTSDNAQCAIVGLAVKNCAFSPIALLNGLKGDAHRRLETLRWISHLGAKGAPLVPGLVRFYSGRSCDVDESRALATALEQIGSASLPALPILESQLSSPNKDVVSNTCAAIAAIGPSAKHALPLLLELRRRAESPERSPANRAINLITGAAN